MITCVSGIIVSIILAMIWGWAGFVPSAIITVILALSPIEGLKDRKLVSEIPLLSLKRPSSNSTYFVEKTRHKATYAFDNRSSYAIDFVAYEEETVFGSIKVYESQECDAPLLRIFERQPINTAKVFTFAPFTLIEYVFLLPEGTFLDKKNKETKSKPKVV